MSGEDVAGGMVIMLVLIALGGLIVTVSSCTARHNVRIECDNYGKTELPSNTNEGDVFYSCAPIKPRYCITITGPERRCTQWSDQ
jgi:hypothetical protein